MKITQRVVAPVAPVVPKFAVEVGSVVEFTTTKGKKCTCLVVKNNLPSAKLNPFQLLDLATNTIRYGEMPALFKVDRVKKLHSSEKVEIILG